MSIVSGYLGLFIGGLLGVEFLTVSFGLIGFLSPGLYKLEQIHKGIKSTEDKIDILKLQLKETRLILNNVDKKVE